MEASLSERAAGDLLGLSTDEWLVVLNMRSRQLRKQLETLALRMDTMSELIKQNTAAFEELKTLYQQQTQRR